MKSEQAAPNRPWETMKPQGQMLRPQQVIERTGLSRTQIYQMIADQRFPPFIKLSTRASALPESWLAAFIEQRAELALSQNRT